MTRVDDNEPIATVSAVLLDMDGTLVNSERSVVESWNRLFRELGTDHRYVESFHGIPAQTLLRQVLPHLSDDEVHAAFRTVQQYEIDTADYVQVLPGVADFLADLQEAEAALGRPCWTIVTSCTRDLFESRFARQGLPIPDTTVTADQITHGKPDPEPYLTGAARLGVAPEQCLVVEDAIPGLTSGRDAGCVTAGVSTTTAPELVREHADLAIGSLAEVTVRARDGQLVLLRRPPTTMN